MSVIKSEFLFLYIVYKIIFRYAMMLKKMFF